MPTVTKTIGTSSRDYSTITAWEADLDNGAIYSAGDTAIGEMYADSVFSESPFLNAGLTINLALIRLKAASTDLHDGTAGTGVIIDGEIDLRFNSESYFDSFEITGSHSGIINILNAFSTIQRCIIHTLIPGFPLSGIQARNNCCIHDNIIYNIYSNGSGPTNSYGIWINDSSVSSPGIAVWNNTVHDITRDNVSSSASSYGIYWDVDDLDIKIQNNICTQIDGTSTGSHLSFKGTPVNIVCTNNISSDSTASGSGSLTNKSASNQYVSIVVGSEDLHLKAGADCIDAGIDLGTTKEVNLDIDYRDRDAEGDVWDIGADEYVPTGTSYQDAINLVALSKLDFDAQRRIVQSVTFSCFSSIQTSWIRTFTANLSMYSNSILQTGFIRKMRDFVRFDSYSSLLTNFNFLNKTDIYNFTVNLFKQLSSTINVYKQHSDDVNITKQIDDDLER